jgi:hypothetical protein
VGIFLSILLGASLERIVEVSCNQDIKSKEGRQTKQGEPHTKDCVYAKPKARL